MDKAVGHALHDLFEITAAVDGGWLPASAGSCPACAVLHIDLVGLRRAIPAMVIPSRPRDLRLSVEDADRLRPSAWRPLIAAIGTSRDRYTQPLALCFTGLGLAGLLLGVVPSSLPFGGVGTAGGANTAPLDAAATGELPVMQTMSSMAPEVAAAPAATSPGTTAAAAPAGRGTSAPADIASVPTGVDPLVPGRPMLLSVGLLGIGGGLFAVRRFAARPGPMR